MISGHFLLLQSPQHRLSHFQKLHLLKILIDSVQFSSVQSLSRIRLFATIRSRIPKGVIFPPKGLKSLSRQNILSYHICCESLKLKYMHPNFHSYCLISWGGEVIKKKILKNLLLGREVLIKTRLRKHWTRLSFPKSSCVCKALHQYSH